MSRRFRRRPPPSFWLALLLVAVWLIRWQTAVHSDPPLLHSGGVDVVSVLDGRTVEVRQNAGPPIAVRLLGVKSKRDNAGENLEAAHAWLAESVLGKTVRIELDKRRRDSESVNLAYVYLDRTLLNAALIGNGYAEYEGYPGDSPGHAKLMREATLK